MSQKLSLSKHNKQAIKVLADLFQKELARSEITRIQVQYDEANYIYIQKIKPPKCCHSVFGHEYPTCVWQRSKDGWYIYTY